MGPVQAVMWLGYEADHSTSYSTEVNNVWRITFILFTQKKKSLKTYIYRKFNINVLNKSISAQLLTTIVLYISRKSGTYYPVVLKYQ
jgi:hypothetical protein